MVRIRCHCGKTLKLPATHLGKPVACPNCHDRLRVVADGEPDAKHKLRAHFRIVRGPQRSGEFIFPAGRKPIAIGKQPTSAFCLSAASVSRRHARLVPEVNGWRIEDQNSTNGLIVNGQRIRAHALQDGDVLRIGDFELRFTSVDAEPALAADATAGATAIPQQTEHRGLTLLEDPQGTQALPDLDEDFFRFADDELIKGEAVAVNSGNACPKCNRQLETGARICVNCGTDLQTGKQLQVRAEKSKAGEAATAGFSGYLRDSAWSFAFLTQPGDLIKFVILGVMMMLGNAAPMFGCLGLLAWIVLYGMIYSYMFSVIQGAANGDKDLPEMTVEGDGWFDGYISPILSFSASWVFALAPAIVYAIIAEEDPSAPSAGLIVTAVLGVFFWPMIILSIALGGLSTIVRVDLMIRSILTALLPYCLAFLLVAATSMIVYFSQTTTQGSAQLFGGNPWVQIAVLVLIQTYSMIVSMRCVGLFYHHFKDRLAWSWG